ncbi:aldehyde dehydrogenase family 16 member A1-like [Rhopilema esculentum]|uniref:aldehyde dehydrogenase family 16 member A1-like n=1 Tax=Rhopilema esculentum TaxID=499914 RepID=UPI0031DD7D56|eukprot:gene5101-219_t
MASRRRTSATAKRDQERVTETMNIDVGAESGAPAAKLAKKETSKIGTIFNSLDYGPAPESAEIAKRWIASHNGLLGHFIDGKWVKPEGRKRYDSFIPATGEKLSSTIQGEKEDLDQAVAAAKKAFKDWSNLSPHKRARHIYSIARHVQKHIRLIAVLESLDNGKSIRETRDADTQIVARHLYHHAGWAELMETEMKGWSPIGVIGGIVPWNFPLMLLCWKVCPALAMGNTVVLKPASYTRLSALLFADICSEAGLPPGVFNVVTGPGSFGSLLATHPDVDKVAFTGSTEVGMILRKLTAGSGKKLSLELGGKSPVVVFDSADLDSAVEGIVQAIWFNQGQVCSAGSRLLVQETVAEQLIDKVKERMKHLRLGHSLDKCIDMGPIVDESQRKSIDEFVQHAKSEGAEVYQACASMPKTGCFYPPTLVTNVSTTSRIVMEEVFGPVLTVMTFRTAKEAISLANNTRYGLGASVWSEKIGLAMEVACNIKAGTVWINNHNLFDAASGFGGYKESGYGRDGGKEGLYEYVKPSWQKRARPNVESYDIKHFGPASSPPVLNANESLPANANSVDPKVDRTHKLFVAGKQKRPDANYSRTILNKDGRIIGQVGDGNRKDIRDAVEAAAGALSGWSKRTGHNKAQIIYYVAENLELRQSEIANRLQEEVGCDFEDAQKQVTASIQRLFHWAAYADKYGGSVQETQQYGTVLRVHEPVGVLAIACPDESPLLSFISLLGPAIARGNTIVIVPSEKYPLSSMDVCQVFETSDVPPGVVNVVTGSRDHLTKTLTEHQNVNAVWYFGSAEGSKFVEATSAFNIKRTWVNYGESRDWFDQQQGAGEEFLIRSVECKNVWIPMGHIYAN